MDDQTLLSLAASLASRAGDAILAIRTRGFEVLSKSDASPVTEADHAAEAIIVRGLRDATPGIPVIAEEEVAAGHVTQACPAFWLVDPLDGTREFTGGRNEFCVNIGLVRDGHPVLGVVGVPALGEMFGGIVGRGAWKSVAGRTAPISARRCPQEGLTVLASRHHGDTDRLSAYPGRPAGGPDDQFRLRPQVLPPGRGGSRPLSPVRPYHGVGHCRPTGGAGGRRGRSQNPRRRAPSVTASRAGKILISSAPAARSRLSAMSLRESFTDQMKASMKAGDAARASTLRMIMAKLKDTDIAARPKGIDKVPDEEILAMLRGMVKSRRESVEL